MGLSPNSNHHSLTGQELVESLIAEASADMIERGTNTELALQGVRNWYQRQANVSDGAYAFLAARGLARPAITSSDQNKL